jgi:regulator of sigma E protease
LTTGNPGFIWTVFSFLIVIGPLIFVHELGHYFVGRWFGVKADAFSIGFGREILGWTDKRGTRWKVGWLPMGGYVRFAGDMNPASQPSDEWLSLPAEERNRTFQAKSVWKRFLIVAAGPVTNFLFAIAVYAALNMAFGELRTPAVVGDVERGSAAAEAGILPGDRITAINGDQVSRYEEVFDNIVLRTPGERLSIDLVRDGQPLTVSAILKPAVERDRFGNTLRRAKLGVGPGSLVLEKVSLPEAVAGGVRQSWSIVTMTVKGLGQILVGKRSLDELGGPLKTAKFSGEQASLGPLALIWFMAAISINLGFINLLPIPMLDGGHLLFYAIEGIRRRPLRPEAQDWAFRTGLAVLLVLMIFVTLNDLASFGLWSKLGGLIG